MSSQSSTFESAYFSFPEHPVNLLHEYARVLPKSAALILSAIDGWVRTHRKNRSKYPSPEWVFLPARQLADKIYLCRDTIQRWLKWLVDQGYLLRKRAYRWSTDRAYQYCVSENLLALLHGKNHEADAAFASNENHVIDDMNRSSRKHEVQLSIAENQVISYSQTKMNKSSFQSEEGGKMNKPTLQSDEGGLAEEKEKTAAEESLEMAIASNGSTAAQTFESAEALPQGSKDLSLGQNFREPGELQITNAHEEAEPPMSQVVLDACKRWNIDTGDRRLREAIRNKPEQVQSQAIKAMEYFAEYLHEKGETLRAPLSVLIKKISEAEEKSPGTNPGQEVRQDENLTEELREKLAQCQIPVDSRVVKAIAKHHISQVYGALAHIEKTSETVKNPQSVFLFQLPLQPIENLGLRLPVFTAQDFAVEPSPPSPEVLERLRQIRSRLSSRRDKPHV